MFTPANARLMFERLSRTLLFSIAATGFSSTCGNLLAASADRPTVIVAVGAPGEEDYGKDFSQWAAHWQDAAKRGHAKSVVIGLSTNETISDREQLQQAIETEPKEGAELWIVLIGHGTFNGKEAKFNLRSNDVSSVELAGWLQPFSRPLAVINAASASAPFLKELSHTNRAIVTATRSGSEINYTRFGRYISEAISGLDSDLDKDGQTSLLEAFLMASRRVKEFYDSEGRLATEHSLIDDTGDGLGTPPDWFRGIRATKSSRSGAQLDGFRAHQFHLVRSEAELKLTPEVRAKRDRVEFSINQLRETKPNVPEDDYYQELESYLLELARLYERAEIAP